MNVRGKHLSHPRNFELCLSVQCYKSNQKVTDGFTISILCQQKTITFVPMELESSQNIRMKTNTKFYYNFIKVDNKNE